jgi:hypothetical protein
MIKTYRGNLADQTQDRIRIKTNRGNVGYRIVKFQIAPALPGASSYESVVKIYKNKQTTIDGSVDFTDGDLLAMAFLEGNASNQYPDNIQVIFDHEIFNQDFYVTNFDADTGAACNYYIELEQIMLNDNEAAMATLQSIRQIAE